MSGVPEVALAMTSGMALAGVVMGLESPKSCKTEQRMVSMVGCLESKKKG